MITTAKEHREHTAHKLREQVERQSYNYTATLGSSAVPCIVCTINWRKFVIGTEMLATFHRSFKLTPDTIYGLWQCASSAEKILTLPRRVPERLPPEPSTLGRKLQYASINGKNAPNWSTRLYDVHAVLIVFYRFRRGRHFGAKFLSSHFRPPWVPHVLYIVFRKTYAGKNGKGGRVRPVLWPIFMIPHNP